MFSIDYSQKKLSFMVGIQHLAIEAKVFDISREISGSFFHLNIVECRRGCFYSIILGREAAFLLMLTKRKLGERQWSHLVCRRYRDHDKVSPAVAEVNHGQIELHKLLVNRGRFSCRCLLEGAGFSVSASVFRKLRGGIFFFLEGGGGGSGGLTTWMLVILILYCEMFLAYLE